MTNENIKTKSGPSQEMATRKAAKDKTNYPLQGSVVPKLSCHWSSSCITSG